MSEVTREEFEEQTRKYRDAVAPYLGWKEVEAVGAFERPYRLSEEPGDSGVGLLWRWIFRRAARKREGSLAELPEQFLLAITRDDVHIFRYRSEKVEELLASLPRESVSFSTEVGTWAEVGVLEVSVEGRK